MHPLKLRVLRFAARMAAAAAIAAFAITSCNLPKPTPSGNQGSDTGGTYGTNQQSLNEYQVEQGARIHCPIRDETWYLCLDHSITIKWPSPPGSVTLSTTEECVEISVSRSLKLADKVIPVTIDGKAENENIKCTFKGKTTLTVSADGVCKDYAWAVETIYVDENWGTAQAQLTCTCKDNKDCHPYNSPVQIPGLGDQKITWDFTLKDEGYSCKPLPISAGIIYGKLNYCLGNLFTIGTMPLVPGSP